MLESMKSYSEIMYILNAQADLGPPDLSYGAQLFYSLTVLLLMVVAAYYTTKFITKKRMQVFNSKNIKIIEMLSVGVGVSMAIVQVGEQFMLVSISKDKVSLVSELDKDNIELIEKEQSSINFNEQFKKLLKNNSKGNENDKIC